MLDSNETQQNIAPLTPLMRQYHEIKSQYKDYILLFQVGDFYEMFFEDAIKASECLSIVLTQKNGPQSGSNIPLCGVPVSSLDNYISKLVRAGFHVAICDQMELPKPGKIVERKVTQVLTPGTLVDSKLLDPKSPSYLASVAIHENMFASVFVEILTGNIFATQINFDKDYEKNLDAELARFCPDEIIISSDKNYDSVALRLKKSGFQISKQLENSDQAFDNWLFSKNDQKNFDYIISNVALKKAIIHLYSYLRFNHCQALEHISNIQLYNSNDFLFLDSSTIRNLELIKNNYDGTRANSLFAMLDFSKTSMGSRLIKKWISRPLLNIKSIEERLNLIEELFCNEHIRSELGSIFKAMPDIERIIGRIALKRASLDDYLNLLGALKFASNIKDVLKNFKSSLAKNFAEKIDNFNSLINLIEKSINDEKGSEWIIKQGFDESLDRLRLLVENGAQQILAFEAREQQRTGINSLKVRYNNIHGYQIEITNPNLPLVPNNYIRMQTLVSKERYTSAELKEIETEIIKAKNEVFEVQKTVYENIKNLVLEDLLKLKNYAWAISNLDAFIGLSIAAYSFGYVRPSFNTTSQICIENGKHPVISARLENDFIPNSTDLSPLNNLMIITGPNMGGKSTYLRQVALISIMAQIGSFVPAQKADLCIVDRIFTRIGAGDNLSHGKSTFLVEMEETAQICNHATKNSLVILDEVGRGTSTYDGLAIAQAVIEHIYTKIGAKCLFATHYLELTELANHFDGIKNYHAAVKRLEDGIILLHKIEPGISEGSFGIEVAKIANLPDTLITRAQEILHKFGN